MYAWAGVAMWALQVCDRKGAASDQNIKVGVAGGLRTRRCLRTHEVAGSRGMGRRCPIVDSVNIERGGSSRVQAEVLEHEFCPGQGKPISCGLQEKLVRSKCHGPLKGTHLLWCDTFTKPIALGKRHGSHGTDYRTTGSARHAPRPFRGLDRPSLSK